MLLRVNSAHQTSESTFFANPEAPRSFYIGIAKITLRREFLPPSSLLQVYNVIGN
jgi:hypothetical protein